MDNGADQAGRSLPWYRGAAPISAGIPWDKRVVCPVFVYRGVILPGIQVTQPVPFEFTDHWGINDPTPVKGLRNFD